MTRLIVWFSFIIILDIVCTSPRISTKVHKKLENGRGVVKPIKRSGENEEDEDNSEQQLKDTVENKSALNKAEEREGNEDEELTQNEDIDNGNGANENADDTNNSNANDNAANENDSYANDKDTNDNNANDNEANNNDANDNNANDNDANDNDANDNDVNDNDANDNDANDNNKNDNDASDKDANDNDANDNSANDKDANDNDASDNNANDNGASENGAQDNDTGNSDAHDNEASKNDKDANDNETHEHEDHDNDVNDKKHYYSEEVIKEKAGNNNDKEGSGDNNQDTEENENDEDEEQESDIPRRPLKCGDILTPQELLPVTSKLISKVDNPGEGKGIVSSAKSPEVLADRLFEAFFLSSKRIINLTDFDISGLDALQALALSGDVADLSDGPDAEKKLKSHVDFNEHGFKHKTHKVSKYKLLSKKDHQDEASGKEAARQGTLHKKNKKKNRLLRKRGRKELSKTNKSKQHNAVKTKKTSTEKILKNPLRSQTKGANTNGSRTSNEYLKENILTTTGRSEKVGRWRYECQNPADLDTCHLKIKYFDPSDNEKSLIGVKHKKDEHTYIFKQFRKMMQLTLIDEEVEKILESRIIRLSGPKANNKERIETLNEYFNNIILHEQKSVTRPMSDREKAKMNEKKLQFNENLSEGHHKKIEDNHEVVDPDGRRILGIPSIPTPKPYPGMLRTLSVSKINTK